MEDFKVRLQKEEKELSEKVDKLLVFMESDKFDECLEECQTHLALQCSAMDLYLYHLRARMVILDVPLLD
jgi:hypothetical protein